MESVSRFVHQFAESYQKLDLLINNAGLMLVPYKKTDDGFEMQFGVNGLLKLRGAPVPDSPSKKLINDEVAGRLWELSESLCGLKFRV